MRMLLTEVTSEGRIEFRELPAIIGRHSAADISLDDPRAPPLQCMISESPDGGTVIWNFSDDFPLYVNGRRAIRAKLFPGDMLHVGQRRFVFSCDEIDTGSKHSGAAHHKRAVVLANC